MRFIAEQQGYDGRSQNSRPHHWRLRIPVFSARGSQILPPTCYYSDEHLIYTDPVRLRSPQSTFLCPHLLSGLAGDQFSFLQRVQNTVSWISSPIVFNFLICPPYEEIRVKHNIAPNQSIRETLGRVDLIIGQVDFPIEVPRPLLPSEYLEYSKISPALMQEVSLYSGW